MFTWKVAGKDMYWIILDVMYSTTKELVHWDTCTVMKTACLQPQADSGGCEQKRVLYDCCDRKTQSLQEGD
jgi:hypothetical protein